MTFGSCMLEATCVGVFKLRPAHRFQADAHQGRCEARCQTSRRRVALGYGPLLFLPEQAPVVTAKGISAPATRRGFFLPLSDQPLGFSGCCLRSRC